MVCMFSSTCLCEQTFKKVRFQKSKLKSSLSDKHLQKILLLSSIEQKPDNLLSSGSKFHTLSNYILILDQNFQLA